MGDGGIGEARVAEAAGAVDGAYCRWEGEFCKRDERETWGQAMWREVVGVNGTYELRESLTSYGHDFGPKNVDLKSENAFFWDIST